MRGIHVGLGIIVALLVLGAFHFDRKLDQIHMRLLASNLYNAEIALYTYCAADKIEPRQRQDCVRLGYSPALEQARAWGHWHLENVPAPFRLTDERPDRP